MHHTVVEMCAEQSTRKGVDYSTEQWTEKTS